MSTYDYKFLTATQIKLIDEYDPWTFKLKFSELFDRAYSSILQAGSVANARLQFGNNPADGETVAIGNDTYEFDNNGAVTAGNIQVQIGAGTAESRTNLVIAINSGASSDPTVSATRSVEFVVANEDPVGAPTGVYIQLADAVGGTPTPGFQNIVLTSGLAAPADIWNQVSLGVVGWPISRNSLIDFVTIDATNVAADFYIQTTGWNIGMVLWQAYDNAGAPKATTSTLTIDSDPTKLVFHQDGATQLIATDMIRVQAFE